MTKVESYDQEYRNMNKAYNQIWDSLQVLLEADDADREICNAVNTSLLILDQALTTMKEQKTPKSQATAPASTSSKSSADSKDDGKGYVLSFPGAK